MMVLKVFMTVRSPLLGRAGRPVRADGAGGCRLARVRALRRNIFSIRPVTT